MQGLTRLTLLSNSNESYTYECKIAVSYKWLQKGYRIDNTCQQLGCGTIVRESTLIPIVIASGRRRCCSSICVSRGLLVRWWKRRRRFGLLSFTSWVNADGRSTTDGRSCWLYAKVKAFEVTTLS